MITFFFFPVLILLQLLRSFYNIQTFPHLPSSGKTLFCPTSCSFCFLWFFVIAKCIARLVQKKKMACTPEKLVSHIALVCVSYFHWRKCSFYPSIGSKWSDNGKHTEFSLFFFLCYTALMTQYKRESENIQLCMSGTYGISKKVEKTIKYSKSNY